MRSRALAAAGAVAAGLVAFWLVRPAPLPVDVAEVTRGPLLETVDEEGETRVRERYVVAAPTAGRLLRIGLDEGDAVEAGAVVARIEPAPLDPRDEASARARLEAAQATQRAALARLRRAHALHEQAVREAARAERLHRSGTLADETLEQARLEATSAAEESEAARFAADAADHEVEAARAALLAARSAVPVAAASPACDGAAPCLEVHAPVAGEVLRVLEESERIVAAGTPLLEVGDPQRLEIVVDILSADAVRVRPGARFLVEEWGGGEPLEARVRLVEPSAFTKVSALGVEEQRVNVIADLVRPEPRLRDRFRVEARIVVWEGEDVVRVPASALFRRGDDWAVFAIEGGVARARSVDVGHRGDFEVEVQGGLAPGDRVVLHPSDRLRDGMRVEPR